MAPSEFFGVSCKKRRRNGVWINGALNDRAEKPPYLKDTLIKSAKFRGCEGCAGKE